MPRKDVIHMNLFKRRSYSVLCCYLRQSGLTFMTILPDTVIFKNNIFIHIYKEKQTKNSCQNYTKPSDVYRFKLRHPTNEINAPNLNAVHAVKLIFGI